MIFAIHNMIFAIHNMITAIHNMITAIWILLGPMIKDRTVNIYIKACREQK